MGFKAESGWLNDLSMHFLPWRWQTHKLRLRTNTGRAWSFGQRNVLSFLSELKLVSVVGILLSYPWLPWTPNRMAQSLIYIVFSELRVSYKIIACNQPNLMLIVDFRPSIKTDHIPRLRKAKKMHLRWHCAWELIIILKVFCSWQSFELEPGHYAWKAYWSSRLESMHLFSESQSLFARKSQAVVSMQTVQSHIFKPKIGYFRSYDSLVSIQNQTQRICNTPGSR